MTAQTSCNGRAFHPGKKAITELTPPVPPADSTAFISWRTATSALLPRCPELSTKLRAWEPPGTQSAAQALHEDLP